MVTIELCKEGQVISDFRAEQYARYLAEVQDSNICIKIASQIVIIAIRTLVLDYTKFMFRFGSTETTVDSDGQLLTYIDYPDFERDFLFRLLNERRRVRKNEEKEDA